MPLRVRPFLMFAGKAEEALRFDGVSWQLNLE
jgi:predicted 3-demethylubiquinone-9 3-methyltransferase (glyoxalase superfamily)